MLWACLDLSITIISTDFINQLGGTANDIAIGDAFATFGADLQDIQDHSFFAINIRTDLMSWWLQVVNLDRDCFKSQDGEDLSFTDTMFTDGVGVSVLKSNRDKNSQGLYVDNASWIAEVLN